MAAVLTLAAFCGVFIILWCGRTRGTYTGGRNPAQRRCDACGQWQHAYADSLRYGAAQWWETNGEIKDATCKCHKDTK